MQYIPTALSIGKGFPFPIHHHLVQEPAFPFGEDLLQYIWANQFFDRHALRSVGGDPIELLDPGTIQRNSGPDLNGARLRIGGQLWAGTVEVHLRSSEWFAHGHHYDPAYENVVLHVVYEHDAEVRTINGRSIPTLELFGRISTESISTYRSIMHGRGFVPCAAQLPRLDRKVIAPWLQKLALERLERKAEKAEQLFHRLHGDPAETLYHMLAQAFGMKVNAEAFAMLANVLPLRLLMKYRDDPLRTEALLFGQAGLLQIDLIDDHPRRLQVEYATLASLHGLRPMPLAAWKFGRMRPMNFPTLRLAQFAKLVPALDGEFLTLLSSGDHSAVRKKLNVAADGYWETHHLFDRPSKPAAKPLGRSVADHIIINAIAPVLFAFARLQGEKEWRDRAIGLLEGLPAEKNHVQEQWEQLGIKARNAAESQALIELKDLYCDGRRCLSCDLGKALLGRTSPK